MGPRYRSRHLTDRMRHLSGELTTRQRRILEQLANGRTNAEIADSLGLSLSTVKGHLRNAYRQLGVENRRQAVAVLDREGPVASS